MLVFQRVLSVLCLAQQHRLPNFNKGLRFSPVVVDNFAGEYSCDVLDNSNPALKEELTTALERLWRQL